MHRFQNSLTPEPVHPAILAFLRSRTEASFAIAEKHLRDRAFVLGERPTIADFSMAGYAFYPPEETGFDIAADFPALHAWRQRLAGLPGWKPPYQLMPVGTSPPVRVTQTAYCKPACAPRTRRPGRAPVAAPWRRVTTPETMVAS